jgi:hypothetical protein
VTETLGQNTFSLDNLHEKCKALSFRLIEVTDVCFTSLWLPAVVKWLASLPLDPGFMGSNPAEDDGFLWAIKLHSTTSFGREVKPFVTCRDIFTAC